MKNTIIKLPFLLLAFCFMGFTHKVDSEKIFLDKKKSEIQYNMTHPLKKWSAISKNVNGVIIYNSQENGIESVAISVPVSSFDSKNSNRDSHALEVLEALKYPNVKFSSRNIKNSGDELIIKGALEFHNVTREIEIKAKQSTSKNEITVYGSFIINMTDYNIQPPSLLGIKTHEEINIEFKTYFKVP